MKQLLSHLLILAGIALILFGLFLFWERTNPRRLTFDTNTVPMIKPDKTSVNITPLDITIPKEHIHLPILPAAITHGMWETTDKGASHLVSSPVPGDDGNSIIYAHNWTSLFGPLVYVKPGDTIDIQMNDHSTRHFTVKYTSIVDPTDIHILDKSTDQRITLYTCTGFLDSKRFVAVALRT